MNTKILLVALAALLIQGVASADWYLVDDFSGSSIDTTKWAVTTAGTSTAGIEDGRLHLSSPPVTSGSHGAEVITTPTFSIAQTGQNALTVAFDFQSDPNTHVYGQYFYIMKGDAILVSISIGSETGMQISSPDGGTSQTYTGDWRNKPLHFYVSVRQNDFGVKFYNAAEGYGPDSYTDEIKNLADTTPGGLLEWRNNYQYNTGPISATDELKIRATGCAITTSTTRLGGVWLDNVYTNQQIPEPMTLSLLGVGAAAILARRRQ